MAATVRLELALMILLVAAAALMFRAAGATDVDFDVDVDNVNGNDTECLPTVPPPLPGVNASLAVVLQMHQWAWIENLTAPDWAPRTDSTNMFYEFLRPGFVMKQRLILRTLLVLTPQQNVFVNVSFVTNGHTLCASAHTEYRNRTSGLANRVSCSRICHDNFTSLGTRANLPLLVLDDWRLMSRYTEYLAFDALDANSRASYKCMGQFSNERMSDLANLMARQKQCPEGDQCVFNYDTSSSRQQQYVTAGCNSDFRYNWCVSDVDLCSYNIDGKCPVCCRGDLCNIEVAQKAYKKWLDSGAPGSGVASVWTLVLCAVILQWLRSNF